ncbi:Hsp20/alpha crystallin family protein [Bordetella genomosp. 9]|uniref:Heat-shock protein Hsp20 n=1 Tax=Bordetella genomosp. 9 TaxID=1416803 RepID=A0A1W6Z1I9_9BORD|nr:Hsp20/alpha crystallin family protein [Bordetella genomosp. 9]ARP87242.1 heat-shock protein Hsp20 [Bordetella genomosp. 9]ARP91232.1 heat-shock protein Hsp20 [Bordetella genomosp. 9]
MRSRDLTPWMWNDALSMLEQAERLHRQFFRACAADPNCWEPPIDVVETADAVIVHVALPGVPASAVAVRYDHDGVTVSGMRRLPASRAARIHRVEIPYGRFERRIVLPLAALEPSTPEMSDGCLVLTLRKRKETP